MQICEVIRRIENTFTMKGVAKVKYNTKTMQRLVKGIVGVPFQEERLKFVIANVLVCS